MIGWPRLRALTEKLFDAIPLDQVVSAERVIIAAAAERPDELCARFESADMMSDDDRCAVIEVASRVLEPFRKETLRRQTFLFNPWPTAINDLALCVFGAKPHSFHELSNWTSLIPQMRQGHDFRTSERSIELIACCVEFVHSHIRSQQQSALLADLTYNAVSSDSSDGDFGVRRLVAALPFSHCIFGNRRGKTVNIPI